MRLGAMLAHLSTAPPYPVDVDGAGGAGRPAATLDPGAAAIVCADAGAAAATAPSASAAATPSAVRRSAVQRSAER